MRGKFVLVLGAAVAAAVGVTQWRSDGTPASPDGPESAPLRASNGSSAVAAGPQASGPGLLPAPDVAAKAEPLLTRIDASLSKGQPAAAARALLESEQRVLDVAEVRERAFAVANGLLESAKATPGARATESKLQARRLLAAVYRCDGA